MLVPYYFWILKFYPLIIDYVIACTTMCRVDNGDFPYHSVTLTILLVYIHRSYEVTQEKHINTCGMFYLYSYFHIQPIKI